MVEPVGLLIQVAKQEERFDTDIRSMKPALQQTPKKFAAIRVDSTANIFDGVIYNLVAKLIQPQRGIFVDRAGLQAELTL